MKANLRMMAAGLGFAAVSAAGGAAHALVYVSEGQDATFYIDLTEVGDFNITGWSYTCNSAIDPACLDVANDDIVLNAGGSFLLSFGVTPGGSEIGSVVAENTTGLDLIQYLGQPPFPSVGASVTDFYMTFSYVDDVFAINRTRFESNISKLLYRPELIDDASVVPLPAAFPLFLAGIAGVGAAARRRKVSDDE